MGRPVSRRLEFDFEWRITLATVLLLPLLISLGFWQLQREQEKQQLAAAFAARQSLPPTPLQRARNLPAEDLPYLPVRLTGHYVDGEVFLLDNRTREGRYGNEVIHVFQLDDGSLVLVNRGWVPADPARLQPTRVPDPPSPPAGVNITGSVYVQPGSPFLLADEALPEGWPKRLQAVEMEKITPLLGSGLYPYVVRIGAGQPGALQTDWQVINITPARHHAYAVQWFSMAAVLFLFYVLRSTNLWQLLGGRAGDRQE